MLPRQPTYGQWASYYMSSWEAPTPTTPFWWTLWTSQGITYSAYHYYILAKHFRAVSWQCKGADIGLLKGKQRLAVHTSIYVYTYSVHDEQHIYEITNSNTTQHLIQIFFSKYVLQRILHVYFTYIISPSSHFLSTSHSPTPLSPYLPPLAYLSFSFSLSLPLSPI